TLFRDARWTGLPRSPPCRHYKGPTCVLRHPNRPFGAARSPVSRTFRVKVRRRTAERPTAPNGCADTSLCRTGERKWIRQTADPTRTPRSHPATANELEASVTSVVESSGQQAQGSGHGFSAMVVDDHPLVRESMVSRLVAMGAREVVEAASVAE